MIGKYNFKQNLVSIYSQDYESPIKEGSSLLAPSYSIREMDKFDEKIESQPSPMSKYYCKGNIRKNKYWLDYDNN